MALNMNTDRAFDDALEWLAKRLAKNKSEVVRHLVLERVRTMRKGFQFGALSDSVPETPASDIVDELKAIDESV